MVYGGKLRKLAKRDCIITAMTRVRSDRKCFQFSDKNKRKNFHIWKIFCAWVYGGKLHMCTKFEGIIRHWKRENRQKDTDEFWDKNKRKSFQIWKIFGGQLMGRVWNMPAKFEVPILKRNGEKGTWSFDPFLGGAKRGKKDKNWPFHPRKFRLPRIPRGVLHRIFFSPSVVGASLFDIHALVYTLPRYSPLHNPPYYI